ncbi:hypothetical protein C489_05223 [Natrinema versiforme JCM 10478]|uniref:Sugar kinase n=2 Tax=Natrinema versiforme TaxID=88724 RepID=L9Y8T3_9EURY|nr:hypothetical protein C489_05223 [Natrinema versiforme JCM 10478]
MNLKGQVPLFNDSVDPTNPAELGGKVVGYTIGVVVALIALALGTWVFERGNAAAGTEAEAGIPVAGE